MTSQKIRQYLTLTCKTPIPKLLILLKLSIKSKKYGSHTAPSYSYSLSVCQIWWRSDVIERLFWRVRRLTCKRPIPIFWYFISQLLVDMSIWNSYRTLTGSLSIHWKTLTFIGQRSRSQWRYLLFEGTVIYQKLSHRKFSIFFCRHLFVCPIK